MFEITMEKKCNDNEISSRCYSVFTETGATQTMITNQTAELKQ